MEKEHVFSIGSSDFVTHPPPPSNYRKFGASKRMGCDFLSLIIDV